MNIATVVEGPTDHIVLEAILNEIIPNITSVRRIQPKKMFGFDGEQAWERPGWRGVKWWCEQTDLPQFLSGDLGFLIDLLVIQVDADIAPVSDLQLGISSPIQNVVQPCPAIHGTADKLRQVVLKWLDLSDESLPFQVVIAIPSQDIENWVFAALFPADPICHTPDYECIHAAGSSLHPTHLLTLKRYASPSGKRLARYKAGAIKKVTREYRRNQEIVAAGWQDACVICTQAQRFHDDVLGRR